MQVATIQSAPGASKAGRSSHAAKDAGKLPFHDALTNAKATPEGSRETQTAKGTHGNREHSDAGANKRPRERAKKTEATNSSVPGTAAAAPPEAATLSSDGDRGGDEVAQFGSISATAGDAGGDGPPQAIDPSRNVTGPGDGDKSPAPADAKQPEEARRDTGRAPEPVPAADVAPELPFPLPAALQDSPSELVHTAPLASDGAQGAAKPAADVQAGRSAAHGQERVGSLHRSPFAIASRLNPGLTDATLQAGGMQVGQSGGSTASGNGGQTDSASGDGGGSGSGTGKGDRDAQPGALGNAAAIGTQASPSLSLLPQMQGTTGPGALSNAVAGAASAKESVAHSLSRSSSGSEAVGLEVPEARQLPAVGLSTARLLQGAANSEMRVGLRLGEFGNVSIRTSIEHRQISAHISLDHDTLGQLLGSQTRTMEQRIGEVYGIRAAVSVVSGGLSGQSQPGGGTGGGGGGHDGRQPPPALRASSLVALNDPGRETGRAAVGISSAVLGESRLSIRI